MKDHELRRMHRQNKNLERNLKQTQRTLKQTQKSIKTMASMANSVEEPKEKQYGMMSKLLFGKGVERPEFDPSTISTEHILNPKTIGTNPAVMQGKVAEEIIPTDSFDADLMFAATKNIENSSKHTPKFIGDSFYYVEDFNGLNRWKKEQTAQLKNPIKPISIIAFNAKENISELVEFTKQGTSFGAVGYSAKNVHIPLNEVNDTLVEILNQQPSIVAIAPAGLDKNFSTSTINQQVELLKLQVEIAEDFNIPIIISQNNAELELLELIKNKNILGIYVGEISSTELLKELLKNNFYIGVGEHIKDYLKEIPTNRILIATGNMASYNGWQYPTAWENTFNKICLVKKITSKPDKNTLHHQLNKNFISLFFGEDK